MPQVGPRPRRFFIIKILLFLSIMAALLAPATAQAQSRVAGANGWLLPVACNVLSSTEDMHTKPSRGSVNAWDISCPKGSYIYPMAAGKVTYAGCNNAGGYGCWVMLDHQNGYTSIYAHMVKGSVQVRSGQQVDAWTVLGAVGWTGKTSFGPHVHWEIRHTSGRQRIDRYFNLAQMRKCDFCAADGQPVAATGTQQRAATGYATGLQANWYFVALLALFAAWFLWSPEGRISWALNHALVLLALVLVVAGPGWMRAGTPTASAATGDTWQTAYRFMRHWEGNACTHDPVRTYRGITQSTYNAYLQRQGARPADVCAALTEAQAEQIYYRQFWLASGANRLPHAVAITHFDFAVNAGPGAAAKALAVCGPDAGCYNRYRESFYRSLKSFQTYGRSWLSRVSHIRQFTER